MEVFLFFELYFLLLLCLKLLAYFSLKFSNLDLNNPSF